MDTLEIAITKELDGWTLFWADLVATGAGNEALAALRTRVAQDVRDRLDVATLAGEPVVAALRRLFKRAGTDPSRYRPSSEALLRRLLKGGELPAISPLVDLNNCLSAQIGVPCCVMAHGTFADPFEWRAGRPGESYESLKGPFRLEGRPLLCDAEGPLDTPITGGVRVKVGAETRRAWLVAYLPSETTAPEEARDTLERFLREAPVATLRATAAT